MSLTVQSVSSPFRKRVRHATDPTLYDSWARTVTAIDSETDRVYEVDVPAHNLTAGKDAGWMSGEFASYLTDNTDYLLARAKELCRQDVSLLSSIDISDDMLKAVAMALLEYINELRVDEHSLSEISSSDFLAKVKGCL
jgi:hypothetical protein